MQGNSETIYIFWEIPPFQKLCLAVPFVVYKSAKYVMSSQPLSSVFCFCSSLLSEDISPFFFSLAGSPVLMLFSTVGVDFEVLKVGL